MTIIKMDKGLFQIIGGKLRELAENGNLAVDYMKICAYAQELLEGCLGEDYGFPVNIEQLLQKIGIEVSYQPLNDNPEEGHIHKLVGKNIKRVNFFTKEEENYILIDSGSNRAEQRYCLAHELAHYLIHHDAESYYSSYSIMPMLFRDMEEMVADVFAIFLLIPVPCFVREFAEYIRNQNEPVKTSEWLTYLSVVTEVAYENVAIGYQTIRYVCGLIFNLKMGQEEENREKNKELEKDPILKKQVEKMEAAMTEDIIQTLFL